MKAALRRTIHWLFDVGVIVKGIDGVLEMIGGLSLLLISKPTLLKIVVHFTERELMNDAHDTVANFFLHLVQGLSIGTKLSIALYLVLHGVVKLGLVISLLRGKMWAYPLAFILLGLFVLYQFYRFVLSHSIFLLGLTAFDILVMALIWLEYTVRMRKLRHPVSVV